MAPGCFAGPLGRIWCEFAKERRAQADHRTRDALHSPPPGTTDPKNATDDVFARTVDWTDWQRREGAEGGGRKKRRMRGLGSPCVLFNATSALKRRGIPHPAVRSSGIAWVDTRPGSPCCAGLLQTVPSVYLAK